MIPIRRVDRIEIVTGDITEQAVDAIVNAANKSLLGGGGVDGAIHRAAGPQLLEECRKLGGCETGECKISYAHALPATYVIHCVGPVWQGGGRDEDALLAGCYRSAIDIGNKNLLTSMAFPAISTGAYGFPPERAARIALATVRREAADHFQVIRFVCFDEQTAAIHRSVLADQMP